MGDQWDEGDQCVGGRGQWEGGPMDWVVRGCQMGTIGIGRWWGDEWKGGPMRWGTSDMGDQWDGVPMSSNNVLGDQWVGGPMRRGPMRWGTNEMGDQWADPIEARGTFYMYWYGLTVIPTWTSNYIHHKVLGEITYPFPNFNGAAVEV